MLRVFTARIGRWMKTESDAIDITRKSGKPEWLFLAPSWAILRPAINARKRAEALLEETYGLDATARGVAQQWLDAAWDEYVPLFMAEMRVSYGMTQANAAWGNDEDLAVAHGARANRPMWDNLLSRQRVILCCYCSDAEHCHRTILRRDILPKLGAEDCGEMKLCEAA
jgi:hypothetical protein